PKLAIIEHEDALEDEDDDDLDYNLADYKKTCHSWKLESRDEIEEFYEIAAALDNAMVESRDELRSARVDTPIELVEMLARKLEPFAFGREIVRVVRRMFKANRAVILQRLRSGDLYCRAVKTTASEHLPWTRLFGLGSSHRRSTRLCAYRLRALLSTPYLKVLFLIVYAMMDGSVTADAELPHGVWNVDWCGADENILEFMLEILKELDVCSDGVSVNGSGLKLRVLASGFAAYKFAVLAVPVIEHEDNIAYVCLSKVEKLQFILRHAPFRERAFLEGFQGLQGL
ncbi:MAG: hypothetical protein AAF368_14145, partial [Planctomycetota bacterium]